MRLLLTPYNGYVSEGLLTRTINCTIYILFSRIFVRITHDSRTQSHGLLAVDCYRILIRRHFG